MPERRRYKADKDIAFNIDNSYINGKIFAPLVTFASIENSFKYAVKSPNGGFFKKLIFLDNLFYISIVNDSEEKSIPKKFDGIGNLNVRKRLELIFL